MKRLFTILFVLITCAAFSQKTVEIYNFSSHNFDFRLETKPLAAGINYPTLNTGNTLYTLTPAVGYVIYTNSTTTGIPYYSPLSIPFITGWFRKNSGTAADIPISNTTAQSAFQNSQQWNIIKFSFAGIPFSGTGYFNATGSSFNYYSPSSGTTTYFDVYDLGSGSYQVFIDEF